MLSTRHLRLDAKERLALKTTFRRSFGFLLAYLWMNNLASEKSRRSVAVVMPVFNESEGIKLFLEEIDLSLKKYLVKFFVVEDCSTDSTLEVLDEAVKERALHLDVIHNERNCGHGPSTIKALLAGLNSGAEVIVSCDGDGQISGADLERMTDLFDDCGAVYVEGVRFSRSDVYYRRLVSFATRVLVYFRCRQVPRDANTPFRAYHRQTLAQVLSSGQIGLFVPNLDISAYIRNSKIKITELDVTSLPRRGSEPTGSTWGSRDSLLPSLKFLQFCFKAMIDWTRKSASRSHQLK